MTLDERIALLGQSITFSSLTEEEMVELAGLCRIRSLNAGEYVFMEGEEPDWLYMVAEGRVKVLKHSSQGKEFIISFFGPGEMFGEVAIFQNRPYPASAQAVSELKVIAIKRDDFHTFLRYRPETVFRMIHVLSGRLRDAQVRLRDLAAERVEQRLARVLIMLASRLGPVLPFTRQEIADMVGTTPETTIRLMSKLKEAGIIASSRGRTEIVDEARLRELSEGLQPM